MLRWIALAAALAAPMVIAQSEATVRVVEAGGEPSYHFEPANLTADPGAAISIVGGAVEAHTFTHAVDVNDRRFDSGNIEPGATKIVRAPTTVGAYPFKCLYHPGMTGTLTVAQASRPTTLTGSPTGLTPAPGAVIVALALAGGALLLARRR